MNKNNFSKIDFAFFRFHSMAGNISPLRGLQELILLTPPLRETHDVPMLNTDPISPPYTSPNELIPKKG